MRLSFSRLPTAFSLFGGLVLAGCGGNMNFPDAPEALTQNAVGDLHGSVFGGHAPLVGAHVYVIQPGTTGYGSQASSIILTAGTLNSGSSDGNVPATWRYVTTDSQGAFNITGDYSCTVGLPVFLYAYGGTPELAATASPTSPALTTFTVSTVNITTVSGVSTFTWTTTTPDLFYTGETITPNGFGGTGVYLNGSTQIITSTPSANSFTTVTFPGTNGDGTYTLSGVTVAGVPQVNIDAVNMATLGNCPSGGTFATGPSRISYIYMNEVSTVATALAFQPFTLPGNNSAFKIGTQGTSAQEMLGLQNAALTAGNLYNIQGADASSTYAGEGHIARAVTAAGNGIVPQRLLNTLGNILASCVDSDYSDAHLVSAECSSLFQTATSNGVPRGTIGAGTAPFDTATAAFNIARYPAGTGTKGGTTFVSALYNLPTGVVPFSPALTATPNDFTVAIRYPLSGTANNGATVTNGFAGQSESIAIDSKGNVWGSSQGRGSNSAQAFQLSPTGALNCTYNNAHAFGYVAVDIADNIWAGTPFFVGGINKLSPPATGTTCTLTAYNALNYYYAYTVVADGAGDTYFMPEAQGTSSPPFNIYEFPVGSTTSTVATKVSQPFGASDSIAHASLDNSAGGFWITNENGKTSNYGRVVASNGTPQFTLSTGGDGQPEVPAIDSSNTAWIPIQNSTGEVYQVTSSGASSSVTKITNASSGAEFAESFGAAIDGNGNVWVSNRGAGPYYNGGIAGVNSIVELNSLGLAVSPSTNYTLGGFLNDPLNLAIDLSGNIWITNFSGDQIVELIGPGSPVVTPFSVASTNGKLGTKP